MYNSHRRVFLLLPILLSLVLATAQAESTPGTSDVTLSVTTILSSIFLICVIGGLAVSLFKTTALPHEADVELAARLKLLNRRLNSIAIKIAVMGCAFALQAVFLLWNQQPKEHDPLWIVVQVLLHVGIVLTASGIVMLVFDRQRQQEDARQLDEHVGRMSDTCDRAIKKMNDTSQDQLLLALTGDPRIYREVRNTIIDQEIIYREFDLHIILEWADDEHCYLKKTVTATYVLHNVKQNEEASFLLGHFEEKECEEKFPGSTRIDSIVVYQRTDGQRGLPAVDTPTNAELASGGPDAAELGDLTRVYTHQIFGKRIVVPPGASREIEATVSSINKEEYVYTYSLRKCSDGMSITVQHPLDLDVQAVPKHPNSGSFETHLKDSAVAKRWRLNAGTLPFQGVEFHWRAKRPTVESDIGTQAAEMESAPPTSPDEPPMADNSPNRAA